MQFATLILSCLLLLVTLASAAPAEGPGDAERPNIVLIFIDDMGFGDLSCFGNSDVNTPHIDQLAADGIRLTQFYTNSPICSPSRVAVATGQYPGRHQIHSFLAARKTNRNRFSRDFLDPNAPSIARKFKDAGYATGHFGKWHLGGGRDIGDAPLPQAYGWDESLVAFEGLGDRLLKTGADKSSAALGRGNITWVEKHQKTELYVDRCIDFARRSHQAGKPFYIHLWLNDVHTGYQPSDSQLKRVRHLDVHPFLKDLYAVLLAMDDQIGRLVDAIDSAGLGQDTLIVLTSDNGPNLPKANDRYPNPMSRTGGFRGMKWSLYEGGIRMPFIARWTGKIPAGRQDDTSVMAGMDFFPTFCSIANISTDAIKLDGCDMSEVLLGEPMDARSEPIVWEYGRQDVKFLRPNGGINGGMRSPNLAVRDGRWKLLVNEDGTECQLYDFKRSTSEQDDVSAQHPDVVKRLTEHVTNWYFDLPAFKAMK